LNLILDIILIYYFGVLGAIIATGSAGIITGCLELYLIFTKLQTQYPTLFLFKCFICHGLAGIVAISLKGSGILMLILCGCLYYSAYLISAWLIKPFDKQDLIRIGVVSSRLSQYLAPFSTNSKMISIENL
jgi:Na+-driven multidrug efflux pump